jgi:hypothetical protein
MTRSFLLACLCLLAAAVVSAHNIGATPITWNREISRLMYDKCASCHRPDGSAFSLMSYADVQPRLVAIKAAVLSRSMPPWGAIKGFGEFRNDQALTQEQIELITDWIQNDAPRGNNRRALPEAPKFTPAPAFAMPPNATSVSGTATLDRPLVLEGLMPNTIPPHQSIRIIASFPNGTVKPLVWLHEYDNRYQHPFLFRKAVHLPAGTVIRGLPPGAAIELIPAVQ